MRRPTPGSTLRACGFSRSTAAVMFLVIAGAATAATERSSADPVPGSGKVVNGSTVAEGAPATLAVSDHDPDEVPTPRFRENGDGTVSDLRTGLMWEKKCRDCDSLHDVRLRFRWSGFANKRTIWDWLDEVNRENGSGFAGHSDWRIPNIKELVTLVDYGRSDPAAFDVFRAAPEGGECTPVDDVACSTTANGGYWSSTTFSDFPAHALTVDFAVGFVDDRIKTLPRYVRAVRGGL